MRIQDQLAARLPRTVDPTRWIDPHALPQTRNHLSRLLRTFNDAMHRCIEPGALAELPAYLGTLEPLYRPYAIEGSGMACALLCHYDRSVGAVALPEARSARRLFSLGIGMGLAFVDADPASLPDALPPQARLRWVQDGFGFYRCILRGVDDALLTEPWSYSGLGRALWFNELSDRPALARAVAKHAPQHQPRIWHGIGLAAAFTGGVSEDALRTLRTLAGDQTPHLTRGALTGIQMRGGTQASVLAGTSVFSPHSTGKAQP